MLRRTLHYCIALVTFVLVAQGARAQYFGKNKVNYEQFDFQSFQTEHFEIFYYPKSEEKIRDVARMAERWYARHSVTFDRTFEKRKPLIFYANDADFHQTNVTDQILGEGTGGFTEPLQERVVMPLTGIYAETDHVLGHELVHSFQFDLALHADPEKRIDVRSLPLWAVEGLAEYLSVGRFDPHTAMWLRDAALQDDIPTLRDLTSRPDKYFPYRYGQAFMAFLAGRYGEQAPIELLRTTNGGRIDSAAISLFGIPADSLSQLWAKTIKETYLPITEKRTPASDAGRLVLSEDLDGGRLNLAPSVSPDGSKVAFLSERDLFNINLFLADVEKREVIEDVGHAATSSHIDAIRFINSAGTWSPDGSSFAFVTFAKGDNEITIIDGGSADIHRRIRIAEVGAITNPAWSPDGQAIAFSGIIGGVSDLFLYDLRTDEVRRLTDDRFADLQPAWSPEGSRIAFVSDRGPNGSDFGTLRYAKPRLAFIDVESGEIETLTPFPGSNHTNPQFDPLGEDLFFLSDQDGFRDIYRMDLSTGQLYRLTEMQTGVSGITALAPAMSVAAKNGRMTFSVFQNGKYNVYSIEADQTIGRPVGPTGREPAIAEAPGPDKGTGTVSGLGGEPSPARASVLPPHTPDGRVSSYLNDPESGLPDTLVIRTKAYTPGLRLDYVAPPVLAASFGGQFGGGVFAGTALYFSDMLGDHRLVVGGQINGGIRDIGGQLGYQNQRERFNYGASLSRTPLRYKSQFLSIDNEGRIFVNDVTNRISIDQASLFFSYPFSMTRRAELGIGGTRQAFGTQVDVFTQTSDGLAQVDEFDLDSDDLYFVSANAALVGDNSISGLTGPLAGARYRFEVSPFAGTPGSFIRLRADYRRYIRMKPFTFALRGIHVGNYGGEAEDDPETLVDEDFFTEEYLGFYNTLTFVRGYSFRSFDTRSECTSRNGQCAEIERLFGSRVALASAELRLPVLGVPPVSLASFAIPTDIALFYDAGLAWNADDDFFSLLEVSRSSADRIPVMSAGLSTRFNIMGFSILEFYLAYPFQRPESGLQFGFQFVPGW